MNSKTRAISEGAMMLAIMAMIMLLNRQFAGSFELLFFVLSVPIVIYSVKYGMKMGVTLCLASLLLSLMFSTLTSIFYLFSAVGIGLCYSYGVIHQWRNQALLSICMIGNLIVTIVTVLLLSSLFGYDINEDIAIYQEILTMFGGLGNAYVLKFAILFVVLLYFAYAILQAMVTHLFSILLLQRLKIKTIAIKNVYEIMFPKWCSFLIILAYGCYLATWYFPFASWIEKVVMAFYCCMLILSIVDGYITIVCYLKYHQKATKRSMYVILFACLLPPIQNLISLVGILDIYHSYRLRWKEGV